MAAKESSRPIRAADEEGEQPIDPAREQGDAALLKQHTGRLSCAAELIAQGQNKPTSQLTGREVSEVLGH